MSDIADFFLNSLKSEVQIELLEIAHPQFSRTYYLCRNYRKGVTVTLENSTERHFEYRPCKITKSANTDNLDAGLQISLGDLGTVIPAEIDRVEAVDGFNVMPTCKYRVYRSTDLTAPYIGPFYFEIKNVSNNRTGATLEAKAPGLNFSKTGELYTIDRFPMLRGFLY